LLIGKIEEKKMKIKSGKEIAKRIAEIPYIEGFAKVVAELPKVSREDLENIFPDYVSGGDINAVWSDS
jgi:hypothetical protein